MTINGCPDEEYQRLLFCWCQPTVKRYCDDRNLPYPPIDPETGELIDGVGWMQRVRKHRHPYLVDDQ